MANRGVRLLVVRIPPYKHPRNKWRKEVHEAVQKRMEVTGIRKGSYENRHLEIRARLYFSKNDIEFHDVDNRLKDIMDALQGRMGGPKTARKFEALVPNDNQIYGVSISKQLPTPQSGNEGHLEIREYR